MRDDDQLSTGQQAAPDLPNGKVERAGVKQRPGVARRKLEAFTGRINQSNHVPMRDKYTLGATCRSGGIDHVRRVACSGTCRTPDPSRVGFAFELRHCRHDHAGHVGKCAIFGDGERQTSIACSVLQAVVRVSGVHRHVDRTALHDRQHGDNHRRRSVEADADEESGLHSARRQCTGQQARSMIELGVGQHVIAVGNRDCIRLLCAHTRKSSFDAVIIAGDVPRLGTTKRHHFPARGLRQKFYVNKPRSAFFFQLGAYVDQATKQPLHRWRRIQRLIEVTGEMAASLPACDQRDRKNGTAAGQVLDVQNSFDIG
ncbi:hypothetical protein D3C71_1087320 [compost metagenome]